MRGFLPGLRTDRPIIFEYESSSGDSGGSSADLLAGGGYGDRRGVYPAVTDPGGGTALGA